MLLYLLGMAAACRDVALVGSDCPEFNLNCLPPSPGDDTPELPRSFTDPRRVGAIDQLDLLLVMDNSPGMAQVQQRLADALPQMLTSLQSGDRDQGGMPEFRGVSDIHAGVISTDMGAPYQASRYAGCPFPDGDGRLVAAPVGPVPAGCAFGYPDYLSSDDSDPPQALGRQLGCLAPRGTDGCGFGSGLEATLKALWGDGEQAPVFSAGQGHGDGPHEGFVRPASLLLIILVTDRDDCSSANLFQAIDPATNQSPEFLCSSMSDQLFDIQRYVAGLSDLRSGLHDMVVFAVMAGVPPDLVSAAARQPLATADLAAHAEHYESLLQDLRMQESWLQDGLGRYDGVPACDVDGVQALPARRLARVVQGFGPQALMLSVCDDMATNLDAITEVVSWRLGAAAP